MAQVPISMQVVVYPRDKSTKPFPATIVGYAWSTGLVAGQPLPGDQPHPDQSLPGPQPHPEHPIVLPPVTEPPPVEGGDGPGVEITLTVKPAPAGGGWGVNTTEGWYYAPGPGQAGPKRR